MKQLEISIKKFCNVFGREGEDGFNSHSIKFTKKSESKYPKGLAISPELDYFYSNIEFSDTPSVGGFLQLDIQETQFLAKAQDGWMFISSTDGSLKNNPGWDSSWVVFATHHGDVIVADTAKKGTPIYGSIQQKTFKVAGSLAVFFDVISDCMECEFSEFKMDIDDETYEPRKDFLVRIQEITNKKLSEEESAGFFRLFVG